MARMWKSVAFQLAVFCGVLVIVSLIVYSSIFYFGTIRVLYKEVDRKITSISQQLADNYDKNGLDALSREIHIVLSDKIDVETEIYLLTEADGRKIVGNLSGWKEFTAPPGEPINRVVIREDRPSSARIVLRKLPNGYILIVGRDMKDLNEVTSLIWRTIGIGSIVALMLAIGSTIIFRSLLEHRIGAIRRTVEEIEAGKLNKRIPLTGVRDEFDRLSDEMNHMLDRIEHLMDGVRHVSNTIAHNLRTPLGRIRGHLDGALRAEDGTSRLSEAAQFSIEQIDALITIFDKLLQIAESESGTRRQPFEVVSVRDVVTNVVELYDAIAEAQGMSLSTRIEGNPTTIGDRDLLASALANLIDNALKYGRHTVSVRVNESPETGTVSLSVQDDGPGIPTEDLSKVTQPFYRINQNVQGTGLGLSIVAAIAHLHGASLSLEDASPGLLARLVLPLHASGDAR